MLALFWFQCRHGCPRSIDALFAGPDAHAPARRQHCAENQERWNEAPDFFVRLLHLQLKHVRSLYSKTERIEIVEHVFYDVRPLDPFLIGTEPSDGRAT